MKTVTNEIHDRLRSYIYESEDSKIAELKWYYKTYANNDVKNALWIVPDPDANTPGANELRRSIARAKKNHPLMIAEHIETAAGYAPKWFVEAKVKEK
jgi:hypothetical protein